MRELIWRYVHVQERNKRATGCVEFSSRLCHPKLIPNRNIQFTGPILGTGP